MLIRRSYLDIGGSILVNDEIAGFYLVCWLRSYPRARGTCPLSPNTDKVNGCCRGALRQGTPHTHSGGAILVSRVTTPAVSPVGSPAEQRWQRVGLYLLLIVGVAVLYLPHAGIPFFADDFEFRFT